MQNKIINTSFLAGFVVVCLTVLAVFSIYSTEPTAQKDGATKRTAMLVDVMQAQSSRHRPSISAMGEAVPAQQVQLRPRIPGRVEAISENFVPGKLLKKGDWLVKLESEDYELALESAKAELARAKSLFDIEMGEQEVAKNDYAALDREVSTMKRALILRKPQLNQAKANLRTAEVAVKIAELNLKRTAIRMPFDGQILSQDVNLGSQLASSDIIANVVGVERYWIRAAVPLSQLKWLDTTVSMDTNVPQKSAIIKNDTSWPQGHTREGKVKEIIASLDPQTRMATVLVEVLDPLSIGIRPKDEALNSPYTPLIAGSYVQVELPARELSDVFRVPINYLRKDNTIWVADQQKLAIKDVELSFRDDEYAYIKSGISAGDNIITTNLASVSQGAAVSIKNVSQQATGAQSDTADYANTKKASVL